MKYIKIAAIFIVALFLSSIVGVVGGVFMVFWIICCAILLINDVIKEEL